SLLISNAGGAGARTQGDGVMVVETVNGGTTAVDAFRLGGRVAVGAYEYQLFRGGYSGGSGDDWFLRNTMSVTPVESPGAGEPAAEVPPQIVLYRPEVALYSPVAGLARTLGAATIGRLGTLHERVGEQANLRDFGGRSPYANGAWARVFGERVQSRWSGDVDSRATGSLFGAQAGLDLIRTEPYAGGHRDHAGVYVAHSQYVAPRVSGFALGTQNLRVGRLELQGPGIGAYWTHFGPSGWYLDTVVQTNWFDVKAQSDHGASLNTDGRGWSASLESGHPVRFGAEGAWQIEPQAQLLWQRVSLKPGSDTYSTVNWKEGDEVTGRLGARLQYSVSSAGTLWQRRSGCCRRHDAVHGRARQGCRRGEQIRPRRSGQRGGHRRRHPRHYRTGEAGHLCQGADAQSRGRHAGGSGHAGLPCCQWRAERSRRLFARRHGSSRWQRAVMLRGRALP
ncbi:MAG: autotransporter outer membrane beta-barrel domain-containing protein, partial [Hyphomicrobiales bacterium]